MEYIGIIRMLHHLILHHYYCAQIHTQTILMRISKYYQNEKYKVVKMLKMTIPVLHLLRGPFNMSQ